MDHEGERKVLRTVSKDSSCMVGMFLTDGRGSEGAEPIGTIACLMKFGCASVNWSMHIEGHVLKEDKRTLYVVGVLRYCWRFLSVSKLSIPIVHT